MKRAGHLISPALRCCELLFTTCRARKMCCSWLRIGSFAMKLRSKFFCGKQHRATRLIKSPRFGLPRPQLQYSEFLSRQGKVSRGTNRVLEKATRGSSCQP